MRHLFLSVILLTLIMLQLFGCAGQQLETKSSNTSLVVTYNGKEIHRRNTGWISEDKLRQVAANDEQKVIIFGAPWCKACNLLRKAVVQADVDVDVFYINIDELWANKLASILNIKQVPTMIHAKPSGDIVNSKVGPGQITMYLLLTF